VKRRPDRFTDWEVRKKGEKSDDTSKSGISTTVVKASAYQRVIADNIRIADSTSAVNRRTKTSPTLVTHILETNDIVNEDYVTGLVIERLGESFFHS
jgi:ribosomal protein L17